MTRNTRFSGSASSASFGIGAWSYSPAALERSTLIGSVSRLIWRRSRQFRVRTVFSLFVVEMVEVGIEPIEAVSKS